MGDLTRALIPRLARNQSALSSAACCVARLPPMAAGLITKAVGDNDLRTGDELTKIKEKVQEVKWAEFFDNVLKPAAEKGHSSCTLNRNPDRSGVPCSQWKRTFGDMQVDDVMEMSKRKRIKIERLGNGAAATDGVRFKW